MTSSAVDRTTVTDEWHRPPCAQNEERWLSRCLERVLKGLVHPVFSDAFTASFYRSNNELVMTGISRDGGARFEVACRRLDMGTLRKLVRQFPRAAEGAV